MPGNGLFPGLKLIEKKCVQLERQLFEKPKVALEVFVSVMDSILYNSGNEELGILKGVAEQHHGCLILMLVKEERERELTQPGRTGGMSQCRYKQSSCT